MRTKRSYRISLGSLVFRFELRGKRGPSDPERGSVETLCAKDGVPLILSPDRDHDWEEPVFWSCSTCGSRVVFDPEIPEKARLIALQRWRANVPSDD